MKVKYMDSEEKEETIIDLLQYQQLLMKYIHDINKMMDTLESHIEFVNYFIEDKSIKEDITSEIETIQEAGNLFNKFIVDYINGHYSEYCTSLRDADKQL